MLATLSSMIHALLDTTQVIGTLDIDGSAHELWAEATAHHDRSSNLLTVELKAFLRATEQTHLGETAIPGWLPPPQTVTEHVDAGEAHELANDVFASWCHKLAGMIPH